MSNFLAIATVTATLRSVLQAAVGEDVAGATATTVRPDGSDNGLPPRGVNIYLYQVTPNVAWRNSDLPTRSCDGRLVQRPRVALDLHYLLSFYGAENTLEPQRVLGSVARTLHAQPLLTRAQIEATRQAALDDDPNHFLRDSDLADEVEVVKFMPLSLSLEELSKLWSVFFQTHYTLSMAYLATTVLIEAEVATQRPLPVQVRNISALPFQRARIDQVVNVTGNADPIQMNDTILLRGQQLGGPVMAVRVGEVEITPTAVQNTQITLPLAAPALRAGLQGVQIIYQGPFGRGAESNVAPLVLRPRITVNAASVTATAVPINFLPAVGRRQRVTLYLNQLNAPAGQTPRAYSFPAPIHNGIPDTTIENTGSITFEIGDVEPGNYLVRVQVAGAESILQTDVGGVYNGPTVTIP